MPRIVADLRDQRPLWTVPDKTLAAIRDALPPDWHLTVVDAPVDGNADGGGGSPASIAAIRGAEVYLGFGISPPLFAAGTEPPDGKLRWVHSAAAGVGSSLFPEMRRSDVILTNSAGIHAPPMAEWALAAILYFARGFDFAARAQAQAKWDKAPFEDPGTPVREIAGATLGIVGLGGIGREIATRASALGMRVLATRRSASKPVPGVDRVLGPDGLSTLLDESDFLVLALPDTPETRGLIGPDELARLREGAVLLNLARGAVLDESALVEALGTGRLRGAALDVFQEEPLPTSSPLWGLPNVLLTPHVSPTSRGYWARETDLILENLRRYRMGEDLLNLVDKEHGILTPMAYLLLVLAQIAGLALIPFGLPGLWVQAGALVAFAWFTDFAIVGIVPIALALLLALLAEISEFVLGGRFARRYGGGRRAAFGAILGGVVGAVLGLPIPLIGSIIGAFIGSFVGAGVFELTSGRGAGPAVRAGWGAFVGRVFATALKSGVGVVIAVLSLITALG